MKLIFRGRQEGNDQGGGWVSRRTWGQQYQGNEMFQFSERTFLLVVSYQSTSIHSLVLCVIPLFTQLLIIQGVTGMEQAPVK